MSIVYVGGGPGLWGLGEPAPATRIRCTVDLEAITTYWENPEVQTAGLFGAFFLPDPHSSGRWRALGGVREA